MKKQTDRVPDTPFMNVKDAARVTGLSEYHLRQELAKGNVPHLMCGPLHQGQRPCPAAAAGCRQVKGGSA